MLTRTIAETSRGVRITYSDTFMDQPPQLVMFAGKEEPIEEVVSILLCSGMTEPEVLTWLERRMAIGRFKRNKKEQCS